MAGSPATGAETGGSVTQDVAWVVTPDKAVKVRITVTVSLPSLGTPKAPGYQPPTRMQLRSEATLRNSLLKQ